MNSESAAFWTSAGSKGWYYITPEGRDPAGVIEQLGPGHFNASDISGMKWGWQKFTDLEEAKRWIEVCVRMNTT